MNSTKRKLADPYRIKSGDTLASIAHRSGNTVADLQRLNHLANPNQLEAGETLYLSEASAFGISALFLDSLRHPIENLFYRLTFDGQTVEGKTGTNGTASNHVTQSAQSQVAIWVKELSGTWKQIAGTTSGYGHKLLTLVSDALVVAGGTQPLPQGAPPKPSQPESQSQPHPKGKGTQPPLPKPAQGDPAKNNPAAKHKKKKGPQEQPVIQIGVDIPQTLLKYFAGYNASAITEQDWENAAKDLECEPEVLKAFAEVESGGRLSFWRLNKGDGANVPAILYERHYFSQLTGHKFDDSHPDLSWPTGYRKKKLLHQSDKKMSDGKVDEDDVYGDYASAYLRLINAFRLNADAALKSCSWGKFQIMGANYAACGTDRVSELVTLMCKSEAAQIKLICNFIQKKPASWKNPRIKSLGKEISLWNAVKTKNWKAIAFNYNGPGYKTYEYDTLLERAYEKYKKA